MSLDDLKLRTKMLIPLGVMALVVLSMVAFGSFKLANLSEKASDIIEHRDLAVTRMVRAARTMTFVPYSVFGTLVYDGGTPEGKAADAGFPKAVSMTDALLDEAMKLIPDKAAEIGKLKERFDALAEEAKKPLKIGDDTPGLANGDKLKPDELNKMAEGARLVAAVDLKTRALIEDLVTFDNQLLVDNATAATDLRAQSTNALVWMALVGCMTTLAAGAFSIWLSSSKIANPIGRLSMRMHALAQGDLKVEIEGSNRGDEIGTMAQAVQVFKDNAVERGRLESEAAAQRVAAEAERERAAAERARTAEEQTEAVRRLGEALKNLAAGNLTVRLDSGFSEKYAQIRDDFNEAIDKLKETILAVVSSTSAIQSGTHEISTASDDLSRRTEQQAASLEETAAALEQITTTVNQTAEGAKHAREVVANAKSDAEKSGAVVRRAIEAMTGIDKSSKQVSQIIGVIDEIAFQTNLLALNAGVEAARAGDAGRGFAVVASEVRALAQRSAEAAKEIKSLISTSAAQVDQGVQSVEETARALERIVGQVNEINTVVAAIAASAQEQATGLRQVNTAVTQMDQATQQNAAMVEESTAASHALSQETTQLSGLVGQFQVGGGIAPTRRARPVRAA
jgi:methyl-accepting chemotaxis protein